MYMHSEFGLRKAKPKKRPKARLTREVYMEPINRDRLQSRRKAVGLTQYQLAALCKCTQAAISGLETGNMRHCSEDLARQISKWLDRDMDELFIRHDGSRMTRVINAVGSKHQKAAA